jgi:hypothetical protein
MTTSPIKGASLHELLTGLSRFESQRVAKSFAEAVDHEVADDDRGSWTGARSRRDEIAAHPDMLWSVRDTHAVGAQSPDDRRWIRRRGLRRDAQTIRATGPRFSILVAVHITLTSSRGCASTRIPRPLPAPMTMRESQCRQNAAKWSEAG